VPQLPAQPAFVSLVPQQQQQLSSAVLTNPAQFRSAAVVSSPETGKSAPAGGLLGVAFSPASDVSQLKFSGSFANYSY
jgi:hypothetical protein